MSSNDGFCEHCGGAAAYFISGRQVRQVQAGKDILRALLRRRQFFFESREARSVGRVADGGGDAVGVEARRKPPGNLLPPAHAVDREFRVITALHGQDFPVPEPLVLCDDRSVAGTAFFVMSG
jgi:hypothetical protein